MKKVLIISLILALLTVSAVSAEDISDEIILNDSPSGSFTDLAEVICESGSEVKLEMNYTYNDSIDGDYANGINVDKSDFVIDGQGHTINGDYFANIFIFNADNVTLKNIIFTQSWAINDGGAVYFNGSAEVINCSFLKNRADLNGGAVYFNADGIVKDSTFIYNTASKNGGAIYANGNLLVENTKLYGSDANTAGAIYANETAIINGSHFVLNSAGLDGGAVLFNKEGIIDNCNFSTNQAGSQSQGGAVVFLENGLVNNTNFIFNIAIGNAGAIEFKKNGTVENSVFTRNMAKRSTGAIMFRESGTLKNCTFMNNTGETGQGAVQFDKDATVDSCIFENNAGVSSGAVYLNGVGFIANSTFINNRVSQSYGAAVAGYNGRLTIADSVFLNNKAKSAYCLYLNNYTFRFSGYEVWIHAVNAAECSFSNVTYFNGSTVNTDEVIPQSRTYPGIDFTVEVYDSDETLVDNVTLKTDAASLVYYNPYHLDDGNYTFRAYHMDDDYYFTSDAVVRSFSLKRNSSSVNINISDDEKFRYNDCNITFDIINRTEVRVIIADENDDILLDEITDNDYVIVNSAPGRYSITVCNLGNGYYSKSNDTKVFEIIEYADLAIAVNSNVSNVGVEGFVNFTITVTNNGPFNASEIKISDILPKELKYIDCGCSISGITGVNETIGTFEMISWNITDLNVNESVILWVKVNALSNGTFKNIAIAKANESAGVLNSTNVTVRPVVKWTIINQANSSNVSVGDYVNFTVTVCNNGPSNATGVGISDILSSAFEFIKASDDAEIDEWNTVSWDVEDLSKGDSVSVWFLVQVKENGTFTNWAHVFSDESMIASSNKTVITVNPKSKENVTLNVTSEDITEGENLTLTVTLPYDATGNVTAFVNGANYTSDVLNGTAAIAIQNLEAGNYTIPLSYSGDEKYNPAESEINVTVKEKTSIIVKAPELIKYYHGSERFAVNVTDFKGNPLANKSVAIELNGVSYNRTTDSNGTASMAVNLNSGVYNVTVTVDNETVNSSVTVLATVNGTDVVKVFRNGTQYYAMFLDSQGNYLKNGTAVQFNINGVMYTREVTGDKGLARLNINLEQGEYVITAINPETGENAANNITVISRLVENRDIVKYFRNATQYTVKVIGDDGKAVGANETVKFNINGVFYERTTDESGIAVLNINLEPGEYVITAEYGGCRVSNNITVLPVLTAENLTKKYGDSDQFIATLVNGTGNPYAGQDIEFNVNGVFYNRTTDANGQARLNINLMPGEYIITSSYSSGAITSNKITVLS